MKYCSSLQACFAFQLNRFRSFLTPWIYTRRELNNLYVLDAMREIRQAYDCRLVLCEAAPVDVRQRLQARYDAGT